MGYIYKAINTVNSKSYIGKTKNTIEDRFIGHKSDAANGSRTRFHCAIRKYGLDQFKIEILEAVQESELDIRERFFIATHKPEYNMTAGGDGGAQKIKMKSITDGTIEMRIPFDDEIPEGFRRGFSDSHKLHKNQGPRTAETKKRISEGCSGRKFTEEHKTRLSAANYTRHEKRRNMNT
jgi:group I intron endonuclease